MTPWHEGEVLELPLAHQHQHLSHHVPQGLVQAGLVAALHQPLHRQQEARGRRLVELRLL